MNCPYCGKKMKKGYVQSGTHILWTEKKHKISMLPKEDEILLAKNYMGGAAVEGFICEECKKIVVDCENIEIE